LKARKVLDDAVKVLKASPAIDHWQRGRERIEAEDLLWHVVGEEPDPTDEVSAQDRVAPRLGADVTFKPDPAGGFRISAIALTVRRYASGIDEAGFKAAAEAAKMGCPVSKALTGVDEITLPSHTTYEEERDWVRAYRSRGLRTPIVAMITVAGCSPTSRRSTRATTTTPIRAPAAIARTTDR
jgi:hypothetical protein